jgi:peroxiredoxin
MAKRRKSSGKHHKKDISEIKSKKGEDTSARKSSRKASKKKISGKRISTPKIGYPILIIVIVAVLIVVVTAFFFYQPAPAPSNHSNGNNGDDIGTNIGQTAPDFTLTDIGGNEFILKNYRGKIVILDFMAIRCPPCVQEMGELKEIRQNYYSKGVRIISIDIDSHDSVDDLTQFKNEYGCDWVFATNGRSVWSVYGAYQDAPAIPTLYIIDKDGVVAYRNRGLTDYDILSSEIDKLL